MKMKMKSGLSECEKELEKEGSYLNNTEEQVQSSREKVQATVEELTQVLKEREVTTINALGDLQQTQKQAHLAHKEKYKLLSSQINSCADYAEAVLIRNDDVEILEAHTAVADQCTKLMSGETFKASNLLNADFEPTKELRSAVHNLALGRIFERYNTDSLKSVVIGEGLKTAQLFFSNEFKVMTKDAEGAPSYCQDDRVTVHFQTDSGNELALKAHITDCKNGTYLVSYRPLMLNVDALNVVVKVNGRPVAGNPWKVVVSKTASIGCLVLIIGFLLAVGVRIAESLFNTRI